MKFLKFLKRVWNDSVFGNEDGWAAIPYVISAVGTGVAAYGQYSSARNQERAYEQNARIAEADANAVQRKATYEESQARTRLKRLMGTQRALYAKAGVDLSEGSPLFVLADTAAQGEEDLEFIREGGDVAATRLRSTASLQRFYGKAAGTAGAFGAFGTAASGFAKAGIGYAGSKK
jgi:hypothetical protein